jgi:hypothetical protein
MNFSDDVLKLNPALAGVKSVTYRQKREHWHEPDDFDSQLERDWCVELMARGYEVRPHGWTFHLPGGVDYTPDEIAWSWSVDNKMINVYEVKGDMRQKNARDSRTRFRIAAGLYPCFRWVWVTRSRAGEWIQKVYIA